MTTNQNSKEPLLIATFYHFQTLPSDQVESLGAEIERRGTEAGLRGLMIMATEGINATLSGEAQRLRSFIDEVAEFLNFPKMTVKESWTDEWPFRLFKVKLRPEIVTLGKPEVQPLQPQSPTHLSPDEWHRVMLEEDVIVLDTRNWYETRIGKFKGAVDPHLKEFHEFSDYVKNAELPKDKKILIYCTGGIRCEKAIVEMQNQGFDKIYQLDGGILNYMARYPEGQFEGECFVFDYRVAVDGHLQPTAKYKLCPHCGQPADVKLDCVRCDTETMICITCNEIEHFHTCSKNCANHWQDRPGVKGRSQGLDRTLARG